MLNRTFTTATFKKPVASLENGTYPQTVVYLDALTAISNRNDKDITYYIEIERASANSYIEPSNCNDYAILTLYIEAKNYSTSDTKQFIKKLLHGYHLPGYISNDGIFENEVLMSVRISLNNVEYDDANAYYKGRTVSYDQLGSMITKEDYNTNIRIINETVNVERTKSAFAMIKECIEMAVKKFTPEMIKLLMNQKYINEHTGLSYALLMKVDDNLTYEDQTYFNGKNRYAKKTMTINDQKYYICNHVFHKNVNRVNEMINSL